MGLHRDHTQWTPPAPPQEVLTSTSWGSGRSGNRPWEMEQEERRRDGDFSGMPRLSPCGPSTLQASSCDQRHWAILFDCSGSLSSMASHWRTGFLYLHYRELKARAHSGLALGALEVRPHLSIALA